MKQGTAWLLGCAGLALFLFVALSILFVIGAFLADSDGLPVAGDKVGVVDVIGEITDSREVVEEIDRNREDSGIKAVVVRIDSPGGGVAASQEIHDALLRLKLEKPVVASLGGVAASGGYYVAVACDSIVANPGTLTGSIGVIFSYVTAEELMKKIGVQLQVYKSGPVKDIGSFHREPTPEERALLTGVVDDVYGQFVDAVVLGRRLPRDRVLALADGSVFSGRQALAKGLVDRTGGLREAVLLAGRLGGIEGEPRTASKAHHRFRLIDLLRDAASDIVPVAASPRLEYRFR